MCRRHNCEENVYFMYGNRLSVIKEEKYLGVTDNLSWSRHVDIIVRESYRKLGVICRVFYSCGSYVKNLLYYQIVRSKLDYCSTVWDPYQLYNQRALEKVQRRAGRIVVGRWDVNYTDILKELEWISLHQRRCLSRNILCYRIVNDLIDIPFSNYFTFRNVRPLRSSHDMQIECKFARTDVCKYSYFYHTIVNWNNLSGKIIDANSTSLFKTLLKDSIRQDDHANCHICSSL